MGSAKYTIKEAVQAIQELDFREDTCKINRYIKKRMLNNGISKIINMERQICHRLFTVYFKILTPQLLLQIEAFPCWKNCWPRTKTSRPKMYNITWFYTLIRPPGDCFAVLCSKTLTYFALANRLVSHVSLRICVFSFNKCWF